MKAASAALITASGVVVLGAAVGVIVARRDATPAPVVVAQPAPQAAERASAAPQAPVDAPIGAPAAPVEGTERVASGASPVPDEKTRGRVVVRDKPARIETPPAPRVTGAGKELTDPVARLALRLVGKDQEAGVYWFGAINNPGIPATERADLIEDLNEVGLSDPGHPTKEDLPLITARIELIEKLAPYAMDHVNAAAFQEAYKDLTSMYERLTRGEGGR